MPAFTQGKWKVNAHAPEGFTHADMDNIISADGNYIASVQKKADARLIAAAPELLEIAISYLHLIHILVEFLPDEMKKDLPRVSRNLESLLARIDSMEA